MGFSWQEYWRGLPFSLPGDLPDPGIEPTFPALAGKFTTEPPVKSDAVLYMRVGPQRKLTTKKADAFELWCWRRLLRVPWTARRSKQSIVKEVSPEYSLERLMLRLKLQSFGHLMQRTDSLKDRDARKD